MFGSTIAQLRYVAAIGRGRPIPAAALRSLVLAAQRTAAQRGVVAGEVRSLLSGQERPADDAATAADLMLRRFARQVGYARVHTAAYADVVAFCADRRHLAAVGSLPTFDELPVTTKDDYRRRPDSYLADHAEPAAVFYTSGSSGAPTPMRFGRRELTTAVLISALGNVMCGQATEHDHVVVAHGTRAGLGNTCAALAAGYVGAQVSLVGQPAPHQLIRILSTGMPPTVLCTQPSYLGHLLTYLAHSGGRLPETLRLVVLGGEVVTAGLRARARLSLGPDVDLVEVYGMTETWPAAGSICEAGHLHFDAARAVVEIKSLDAARHAEVGELGTLVVTPLMPFRTVTPFIRFDTQDLVYPVVQPTGCSMSDMPATSAPLGKQVFSVRLPDRVITPRDILEVVESDADVPLPARLSYRRHGQRIDVDVQVSHVSELARERLAAAFDAADVPVGELVLHDAAHDIAHPTYPWRGDLWEPELRGDFHPDAAS